MFCLLLQYLGTPPERPRKCAVLARTRLGGRYAVSVAGLLGPEPERIVALLDLTWRDDRPHRTASTGVGGRAPNCGSVFSRSGPDRRWGRKVPVGGGVGC
jgi:hypothetical protein